MINKKILTLIFVVAFVTLLVGCLPTTNQAPIITSDPVKTGEVGVPYTYDVNATDPDEDVLTYSLVTKPTNMSISPTTGLINWVPAVTGTFNVLVKVSDGDLAITQSFNITVIEEEPSPTVNHAPIITSTPVTAAVMGVAYLYDVEATDPDGDTLTYSLTTNPSGMTINSANGVIDWIPTAEGAFAVEVVVSDGALSDTQNFTITVKTVEIVGIVVLPEEMTLVTGVSETIQSVTALYDIKADFEVPIPLGDCTYASDAFLIAKVSPTGVITAGLDGTATITVSYLGEDDTVEVTVVLPVHNIDTDLYYDTIQGAIDAVLTDNGDTIEVAAGIYAEGEIRINKSLTIQGTGNPLTTINTNGYNHGFYIDVDDVMIKDLIVKNATNRNIVFYNVTVSNATIDNVVSLDSGYAGLEVHHSDVTNLVINNCLFSGNGYHGMRIDSGGTVQGVTITDSYFNDNVQGGIMSYGNLDGLIIGGGGFTGNAFGIMLGVETITPKYIKNVYITGATLDDNNTDPNYQYGLSVYVYNSTAHVVENININYCNIMNNLSYGVTFWDGGEVGYGGVVINATNNWWGSEFGATHNGFPPNGGDAVSDQVDFSNWSLIQY